MIERLSAAYLTEGAHIGDHTTLARLAADVGLPAEQVEQVLDSDRFADAVAADFREGRDVGVTGVPFMVFDRRYAVVGAQDSAVILDTLRQAWNDRDIERLATGNDRR
jgi:predicted DsbA family dithiol-disulfide isomerase